MHDPQSDDPDFRDFDQTVFLESWNKGNTAAYRALLEASPSLSRFVFPSRRLQSIWQWNYYREELAAKLLNVGYRVWIASVVFLIAADGLYTGALWPDTIPVAMPVVELVEIGRRLLDGRAKPQGFNYSRILWEEFEQQTSPHGLTAVESVKTPLDYRLLHYKKTPPRLWHWAKALPVWRRPRNVCPPDRLIDEDAIRLSGNHVG